jgi:integrase
LVAHDFEAAHRLAREGQATVAIFREMCDELLKKVGAGTLAQKSLRDFTAEWLQGKSANKADGTVRRYEGTAKRLLELLDKKADLPIGAVTPTDIKEVFDKLAGFGLAPTSLSCERATISSIFNTAIRLDLISSNPTKAIELPDHSKHKQVKRLIFTPEQVQWLLDAATPEWKTAILAAYYCGLRLGDAVMLGWSNVDFVANELKITQRKTGEAVEVPLHPSLQAHLSAIAKDDTGPLCPGLASTYSRGSSLSREFLGLMKKVGIGNESVATAGKGNLSRLSFHALRKSFNSALANAGVDQEMRMSMTGHLSKSVNDTYTKMEAEKKAKATGLLPSLKV